MCWRSPPVSPKQTGSIDMDAAATTHPPRGSAEALVVERTRQMHRAKALEQLTAAEPPVENGYFRRMYRHAAGRSGGEFAITQGPSGLEYRYVWPDQRENMLDRLIAVINMSPREARNATETDSGSVPINERSREVATSLGQGERRHSHLRKAKTDLES